MKAIGKQRGITLMGFIMVLAVIGVFLFIGIRLSPVYIEYYAVVKDLKAACQEPDSSKASIDQMRKKLERRFFVSYVENVDLKKHLKLIRNGDDRQLNINYEVRKPLIYNLDFVAKFDVTETISGSSSD